MCSETELRYGHCPLGGGKVVETVSAVFDWFKDPNNRGAVQVIAGVAVVIVAWATGLVRWIFGLFRREKPEAAKDARPTQTASSGGVNVGGKVEGNVTTSGERKR